MTAGPIPNFEEWHRVYQAATPYPVVWEMGRRFVWERLWAHFKGDVTIKDVQIVIRFITAQVKSGNRRKESLRLHNLLDPDRFEFDLCDARAVMNKREREPVVTARTKALASIGKSEVKEVDAVSAATILERKKMADMLAEWRAKNL